MHITLNATLSFGLVSFPVGIASAVSKKEGVKFRLLHEECGNPIKTKKVCPDCGVSVEPEEIIHGYEYARGVFVHVSEDEISEAKSAKAPVIPVVGFVEVTGALPVQDSHILVPTEHFESHYATLRAAMQAEGVTAVGMCNLWGSDRPFVIDVEVFPDAMVLQRLYSFGEVVQPDFDSGDVGEEEFGVARMIIESKMLPEITPELVTAPDQVALRALVDAKVKGTKIHKTKAVPAPKPSTNLLADLRKSIASKPKATV